jgi:quercetin dioxygenase-like cupin family protein
MQRETMSKSKLALLLSHSAEAMLPKIEGDVRRRLLLSGMLGAAGAFATRGALAQTTPSGRTVTSADGIVRTTLESYTNAAGEDFRLVLTTHPPGLGLPSHHHSSVAHNYVLEGVAESQYEGEELKRFAAGQSYQDQAQVTHTVFRNADRTSSLKYLIAYTVKKGQPFLLIP